MNFSNEITEIKKYFKGIELKPAVVLFAIPLIIFGSFQSPYFCKWLSGVLNFPPDKSMTYRIMCRFLLDGSLMFVSSVIIIKFILKEKIKDFGFTFGDAKFGFITMLIFFAVMLPVLWVVSASPSFADAYPQGGDELKKDLLLLVFYEFCILVYMLGWEFLWRGFTLFGLYPKFGIYAVFIQMIPFFILHRGKPELELFASIFAGIILGIQALRARSFLYAWFIHFLVMLSIDFISIIRSNLNFYKLF